MRVIAPAGRRLAAAAAVAVALAGACGAGGAAPTSSGEPATGATVAPGHAAAPGVTSAPEAPLLDPGRALSYVPGDAPTDRRIAAAQAAHLARPGEAGPLIELAFALVRRARETSAPGLVAIADDAVAAARARAPGDPAVGVLTALVLRESHRFGEAAEVARRLIAERPDDATAHLLLGDALLELGQYAGAADAYQRAMDLRPDLRAYNRGAHLRWLHGDVEGAIELLELALDAGSPADPESTAWCWVDLGWVLWHRGDAERARLSAERALSLVAEYVPALGLLGAALEALGRTTDARAALERAVVRAPSVELLARLADLHRAEGRTADADRYAGDLEALAKDDPAGIALFWARRGVRAADAVRLAEEAVRARPTLQAFDALALALARAGRAPEARDALARARALGTADARLDLHAAVVTLAAGDTAAARASLESALRRCPYADPLLAAELRGKLGTP